jgi:ribonuclease VapC
MFVDASAIVAILTRESEADNLADTLEKARTPITSPIAIFEATLGICRKRHVSVEEAEQDVGEFLELAGVRIEPITDKEARTALAAFSRYGKSYARQQQFTHYASCRLYRKSAARSPPTGELLNDVAQPVNAAVRKGGQRPRDSRISDWIELAHFWKSRSDIHVEFRLQCSSDKRKHEKMTEADGSRLYILSLGKGTILYVCHSTNRNETHC